MQDQQEDPSSRAVDFGVVLFLLTALAYCVAFAFEAGYIGYFGVPVEFAEVNLKELLLCASAALGGVGLLANVTNLVLLHWPQTLSPVVHRMLASWLVLVGFVAASLALRGASWSAWVLAMILPALIGLFEFVLPLWWYRGATSYSEKVEAAMQADKDRNKGLGPLLARRIGVGPLLAIGGAIALVNIAHSTGIYAARKQENFLVAAIEPSCVVLRLRGEEMLCVSLDLKARAVTSQFRFLPAEGTDVRLQRVGRLQESALADATMKPAATPTVSPPAGAPKTSSVTAPAPRSN